MANRNYFTLGLDERSCNFCIENVPDRNSKKVSDSIVIFFIWGKFRYDAVGYFLFTEAFKELDTRIKTYIENEV